MTAFQSDRFCLAGRGALSVLLVSRIPPTDSSSSSRLVINYCLLVSYRVVLMKLTKHGALDVRHVAVVGNGSAAHDFARTH